MGQTRVEVSDWIALTLLLLFCFLLLFWHQATLPMQEWDESRLATNALEMVRSENWAVPQYNGLPDHWNTKPPLLIWAIASLMWLGLPPLLALRVPAFLAVVLTITLAWSFCLLILRDRLASVISGVLLITSGLYAGPHVARTGDYDALLAFFILSYSLAFWLAIEDIPLQMRWMRLSAFAVLLAMFTKGIAALMPLPGLLAFSMLRGRLTALLRSWQVWALAVAVITVGLGYYFSREIYDPGYLLAVWNNEVWGRFSGPYLGIHNRHIFYYPTIVLRKDFGIVVALMLTPFLLSDRNSRTASFIIFCLLFSAVLLAILTAAYAKYPWYAAPIYPPLAMAAGLGISGGIRRVGLTFLRHIPRACEFSLPSVLNVSLVAICIAAYFTGKSTTARVARVEGYPQYNLGQFFEDMQTENIHGEVRLVVGGVGSGRQGYYPIAKFYMEFFNQQRPKVVPVPFGQPLPVGSKVATCEKELQRRLTARPGFRILWKKDGCLFGYIDPAFSG